MRHTRKSPITRTSSAQSADTKKSELFQRYNKMLNGDRLPDLLKAKVVLRHSSLTEQAAQKVENWLAGTRDLTSAVRALCRLDTDEDVKNVQDSLFVDGDPDGDDARHRRVRQHLPQRKDDVGHDSAGSRLVALRNCWMTSKGWRFFCFCDCPIFRATSPLSRGRLRSKGHGKLSMHYAADLETIESNFRCSKFEFAEHLPCVSKHMTIALLRQFHYNLHFVEPS